MGVEVKEVDHSKFREDFIKEVFNNTNYEKGIKILIEWWNSYFGKKYNVSQKGGKEKLFEQIVDINKKTSELNTLTKNVVISIAGMMATIVFSTEPLDRHYEETFKWLEAVRNIARSYHNEFSVWYWNRYIDIITCTGEKVHIMEIPMDSQTDGLKIAYCDYLHITNQGGIKEIRRILGNIENDEPRIQVMKYRTLCNIYADSPSQRNNKQIKEFGKKIMQYSSGIDDELEKKLNVKYMWYLKSATYSSNPSVKKEFFSLPDKKNYDKMVEDMTDLIQYLIYKERETFKAVTNCIPLINFAVKNEQFADATHFLLLFVGMAETFKHANALDIYYPIYKNVLEILLSVIGKPERSITGRLENRFSKINDIFFNEESVSKWDKLDYVLRKKILPTSPLGKVTQRLIEDYFNLAYKENKKLLDTL
jgi:hypothetical protein